MQQQGQGQSRMRTRLAQAFAGQPARQGGRSNDKSGDRTQVQMWREGTARTGQGQDKVQCKTGSNRIKYRVVQDSKRTVGDNRGRDTGSTLLQQYNTRNNFNWGTGHIQIED